ncbi:hypothetical protein L596_000637 [Steinernema carpocapsae]|uniref:Snake toxin/toxin-like domain-containing protein n=1 Tax=Steinernema carpocapsae TaxID=34508 RepID=A0A4U8UL41_STECR|nr:hypothetical protein L596_000637 [Steinernema carpocapsae]
MSFGHLVYVFVAVLSLSTALTCFEGEENDRKMEVRQAHCPGNYCYSVKNTFHHQRHQTVIEWKCDKEEICEEAGESSASQRGFSANVVCCNTDLCNTRYSAFSSNLSPTVFSLFGVVMIVSFTLLV